MAVIGVKVALPERAAKVLRSVGFKSEEELVHATVACIKRARTRKYRIEFEVDAGVGIADLLLAKRALQSTSSLRALASISPRLAILLSHEVGSSIHSREDLAECLGTTTGAAQRLLSQLTANGLALGSAEKLTLTTVSRLPFERVIAIEAKISEWQRVLVQAYRNLQFANESWVVIDHAWVRPALAQLDRFRNSGVGLASLDKERGLFIHSSANSRGPMAIAKSWQAQAVLSARAVVRRPLSES